MEQVAQYPRPPLLVPCQDHILVKAGDLVICETTDSFRVLETFHPPPTTCRRTPFASTCSNQ